MSWSRLRWRWSVAVFAIAACGDNRAPPDGSGPEPAKVDTAHSIAAARFHACAIPGSGELYCWGYNFTGALGFHSDTLVAAPPTRVDEHTDWASVASGTWLDTDSGGAFTCALRTDGERWCWGDNQLGELGDGGQVPFVETPHHIDDGWRRISAGGARACGVKLDGTLWCWGAILGTSPDRAPRPEREQERWIDVAVGDTFTCGVRSDRALACWGDINVSDAATDWTSVDAASDVVCGTKQNGSLWCFGNNQDGELGNNTVGASVQSPQHVVGVDDVKIASVASDHVCAISTTGALSCWGLNANGQLGIAIDNSTAVQPRPALVPGNTWLAIAGTATYTCGRTSSGELMCWGERSLGIVDPPIPEYQPRQVGTSSDWSEVSPGDWARKTDGSVHKWHMTGVVKAYSVDYPVLFAGDPIPIGTDAVAGSLAGYDLCFVKTDGSVLCDDGCAAGIGSTVCPASPDVQPGSWQHIAGASGSRCGIDAGGTLNCWGQNLQGAFGDGTTTASTTPVPVSGGGTWSHVSMDAATTCGVQTNGSLWCWGQNDSGQVGVGTSQSPYLLPQRIGTALDWTTVTVGGGRACGLRATGALWCWGAAHDAGLGDGATVDRLSPVQIGTAAWTEISVSSHHICGIQADHSLWCWGFNMHGQVGVPGTADVLQPVKVGDGWSTVAAGPLQRTCAIELDGTLWCWGQPTSRNDRPLHVPI